MTKKHFVALARIMQETKPKFLGRPEDVYNEGALEQWEIMVDKLATFCINESPRFKRDRWMDFIAGKCGPNGGKIKP